MFFAKNKLLVLTLTAFTTILLLIFHLRPSPASAFCCGTCPGPSNCGPSGDWCCAGSCDCCCDNQCQTNSGWNAGCPSRAICCSGSPPPPPPPPPPVTIKGTVYRDLVNGSRAIGLGPDHCVYSGPPPANFSLQPSIHLIDSGVDRRVNANPSGQYSFANVPPNRAYILTITPPENWRAQCPQNRSLTFSVGSGGPPIIKDFYLSPLSDPWFQTVAGNVHAQQRLTSQIPQTCVNSSNCQPFLSLTNQNARDPGIITYGESLNLNYGHASDPTNWNWQAQSPFSLHYNYTYFIRALRDETQGIFAGSKPTDSDFVIFQAEDNQTTSGFYLGEIATEKAIVLIDGNLNIQGNIIVKPGSFLMFIVSQDINIGPDATIIEGIYVADGLIQTESRGKNADNQLQLNGTFVSWSAFSLNRDLADDNFKPAELFTFRPDFVFSAPEEIRTFDLVWNEVAP